VYSHSSAKPANLAKIVPADVETIDPKRIVKNKKNKIINKQETAAEHMARGAC